MALTGWSREAWSTTSAQSRSSPTSPFMRQRLSQRTCRRGAYEQRGPRDDAAGADGPPGVAQPTPRGHYEEPEFHSWWYSHRRSFLPYFRNSGGSTGQGAYV